MLMIYLADLQKQDILFHMDVLINFLNPKP